MPRIRSYTQDLRDHLVSTTYDHLSDAPVETLSVRDLAAEVGTSTNAIYTLFQSKGGLVDEVVMRARCEFVTVQRDIVDRAPTTLDTLISICRAHRTWARQHPDLYRLMFGCVAGIGRGIRHGDAALGPVRTLVRALMDVGVLRPGDVELVCLSLWASTHGHVLLEMNLWPSGAAAADALFTEHLECLTSGLVAAESLATR